MKPIAQLEAGEWRQLNRLLQQALELDVAERSTWLESLPADSTALRPLLETLLASADGDLAIDENLLAALPIAAAALDGMRHERAGDLIGPWRLEHLLGEGGMGTVWRAQRADGILQRTAALKLPRAEWVDRGLAARIARERAILARLQHPHIAVLYDAGVTAEGRPYLALEYVEGPTIAQFVATRSLSLEATLKLYVDVVRVVAYAHAKLVIHRDLKPSNVLVTSEGTPKLLDFGIAKLVDQAEATAGETALTRLGGRALTPAYAAPEQILGEPVSVAADIYALGVMLYELLTGARPYVARSDAPRALEHEILQGSIRRPSDAAGNKDRAHALRGDLDAILLKALKARPEERYETAAAFADDIERKLDGRPVRARPDSRSYRLRKFVSRNRIPVAAGCAVVLALGAGLGFSLWQAGAAREQADLAREQAERATALNTFVLSLIRQADPNASQASRSADLELLKSIERRVETEFRGSAGELLQLRSAVAEAYARRGHDETARVLFGRALDEAPQLSEDPRFLKARALAAGFPIYDEQSVKDLDRVIDRLRSLRPAAPEALVDALIARVGAARLLGRPPGMTWDTLYADAREAFDLALRHLEPVSGRQLHSAMSLALYLTEAPDSSRTREDRAREAIEVLETALANARADPKVGPGHFARIIGEAVYGATLCRLGRRHEGMRRLWDAIAMARTNHTDDAFTLDAPYSLVGSCMAAMGDTEAAAGYYVIAQGIAERRDSTEFSRALHATRIAVMMCSAERTDECIRYADQATKHVERIPAGEFRARFAKAARPFQVHALIARGDARGAEALALESLHTSKDCCEAVLRYLLGRAQLANGNPEAALRSVEDLLSLMRGNGLSQEDEAEILVLRTAVELALGRTAEALATIESAMPTARKSFPTTAVVWANAHQVYGQALVASGRARDAVEPLRSAYGFWLGHAPKSFWAAEAEYWLGQSYLAAGDTKRGRWMVEEARRALANSTLEPHRALAAGPATASR
jgi:serine/threonine-protein kinase